MFADMLVKMDESGLLEGADEINLCLNGVLSNMEMFLLPLIQSSGRFVSAMLQGMLLNMSGPQSTVFGMTL